MVYLPTKLGHLKKVNVGKYSSTMEHMGYGLILALLSFLDGKLGDDKLGIVVINML